MSTHLGTMPISHVVCFPMMCIYIERVKKLCIFDCADIAIAIVFLPQFDTKCLPLHPYKIYNQCCPHTNNITSRSNIM